MIHRGWSGLIVLAVLALGWSFVRGDSDPPRRKKDDQQAALMRAKLASSQKIGEGLVSKDFGEITNGAEELRKICRATEWEAHSDSVYAHHRKELIRQSEKMIGAAARENPDGAAYSYVHALTTCISCHDYCRDVLKIASNTSSKVVPIPTTTEDDDMPLPARTVRR